MSIIYQPKTDFRFGRIGDYVYVRRFFVFPFRGDDLHSICVEQKKGWLSGRWQRPTLVSYLRYFRGKDTLRLYIEALNIAKQKFDAWSLDVGIS